MLRAALEVLSDGERADEESSDAQVEERGSEEAETEPERLAG
jgi:hypothetical protein